MATSEFLCDVCPAKGKPEVDPSVTGASPFNTVWAFKSARLFRFLLPQDQYAKEDTEFYLDCMSRTDEFIDLEGEADAAHLGVKCAERVLEGSCVKELNQVVAESELDF